MCLFQCFPQLALLLAEEPSPQRERKKHTTAVYVYSTGLGVKRDVGPRKSHVLFVNAATC